MEQSIILERAEKSLCPICKKDLTEGKIETSIEIYNDKKVFVCTEHIKFKKGNK